MSAHNEVIEHVTTAAAPMATVMSGEKIVYLMGMSFIVGCLFTIFILLMLDFMKRKRGIDKD